jgi:hypothetical protein
MGALIPLKNGIQILGMGMDPGFHRGDDSAGMTELPSPEARPELSLS